MSCVAVAAGHYAPQSVSGRERGESPVAVPLLQCLVLEVRGRRREGVEFAVELRDRGFRLTKLLAECGDRLVPGDFAGGAEDGAGDLGVPLGEDVVGAVDGGVADLGFAGEVLLGEGAVGVQGLAGPAAG